MSNFAFLQAEWPTLYAAAIKAEMTSMGKLIREVGIRAE